jgi:hypothetical protein
MGQKRDSFRFSKTDTAVNLSVSKDDHYTAIFTATKSGNSFSNRVMLPVPPNDSKTNTGNAIISGDGNTLLFTKCGVDYQVGNELRCKIFR